MADLGGSDVTVAGALTALIKAFARQGLESPAVDARLLVAEALQANAADLIRNPERVFTTAESARLHSYAERRLAREPVSRILGRRGFYGRAFEVTPATLDPRPDTETLIDAALEIAGERDWLLRPIRIVDVGTGSGCILITLLAELPNASGIGIDLSAAALEVARRNAFALGVSGRAVFVEGDGLTGLTGPFDLVISNPPYIPASDIAGLDPEVREFDPRLALDGGADGLDVYRLISSGLMGVVPSGVMMVEVGAGQAVVVGRLLTAAAGPRGKGPRNWTDLGGHVRCVAVETQHQPSQSKTL